MNLNAKYDVFISYSRKDYVDETGREIEGNVISALMSFLDKNDVTYWIDKKGIYSGDEFSEIIVDAIMESKMMIFVSSVHSNISDWTPREILLALQQGKLVVPFKIDNSLYGKKFLLMLLTLDYIEYFANPDAALKSLLRTINNCKAEYDNLVLEEKRRKEDEMAESRKRETLEEIKRQSEEFMRRMASLDGFSQQLVEKHLSVGNTEKICPVCGKKLSIGSRYCTRCGWLFNPVFEIDPRGDENQIFVMRSNWNALGKDSGEVKRVKEECEKLIKEAERVCRDLRETVESQKKELDKARKRIEELERTAVIPSQPVEILTTTKFPRVEIGDGVLRNVPETFQGFFVIGNEIYSIGACAFSGCHGLSNVTIANSVTVIGDYAFRECCGLTNVAIPNGVTAIGEGAFRGCNGLTSVTLPYSVTSIGNGAFGRCDNIDAINVPKGTKEKFKKMLDKVWWTRIIER